MLRDKDDWRLGFDIFGLLLTFRLTIARAATAATEESWHRERAR